MLSICKAKTADQILGALEALGAVLLLHANTRALFQAVHGKVLVVVGPCASSFWRSEPAVGIAAALHTNMVCMRCTPHAVHGTCEHTHAVHFVMNPEALEQTELPERKRQKHVDPDPAAVMLQPGPAVPSGTGRAPQCQTKTAPPRCERALVRLLEDLGLAPWQEDFAQERITINILSSWTAADIVAMMPQLPRGPASQLLISARQHVDDDLRKTDKSDSTFASKGLAKDLYSDGLPPLEAPMQSVYANPCL